MRAGAGGGSGARNFSLLLAFAAAAAGASAQEPFVKVGPETVYDAGIRCAGPFFAVADFDRDGRQDFVRGNTPVSSFAPGGKPGALMVWMAQPDGSFSEQAAQLFSGPVTAAIMFGQVRVGDVNGDGLLDIFVPDGGLDIGDNGGSTPKLALGTPTGFVDASARFAGMPTTRAHNGVLADIDRNGTLDAFVGGTSDGPKDKLPFLLLNDGNANFTYSQSRLPAIVADPSKFGMRQRQISASTTWLAQERFTGSLFADVDRDGYPDLIVLPNPFTPTGLLFLNDRSGDFSRSPWIELPPGLYGSGWMVRVQNPDGTFVTPYPQSPGPSSIHLDSKAVDVNGDGYPDLVILQTQRQGEPPGNVYYRGGRIQILINQGGRGFVDETAARGAPGFEAPTNYDAYHSTLRVVDVNGDGFPDIVATRAISNYEQHVFLNDGTGRFTRASLPGLPQDGLHVVLSGGIGQPTRIANVQFRYRNGEAKPTPCTLAVQTYEMAAVPIPATISVVEYYNASLDHYFVTPLAAEQANLDTGLTPTRWARTGKTFNAFESAAARTSPICRFYIPPALGDSHFFGRAARRSAIPPRRRTRASPSSRQPSCT